MQPQILQSRPAGAVIAAPRLKKQAADRIPTWPTSAAGIAARSALHLPTFALLDMVAPATVEGLENLAALDEPLIFAANHSSHIDSLVVLRALPGNRRRRVAVAAAADYFFDKPLVAAAVRLFFNAFPFCRTGGAHRSLEHCGAMLDSGWSLLVYPEGGRRSEEGIGTFKGGVGMLAIQLGAPVVPVLIEGTRDVLSKGARLPRPGQVRVAFGEPLRFESGVEYSLAAQKIENAVRALGSAGSQK